MAMFKLPRLKANLALVNGKGNPLDYFLRFWNIEVAPRIEAQEASQDKTIADIAALQLQQQQQLDLIQQALQLAGLALETAQGGSDSKSGSNTATFSLTGTGWVSASVVNFTGVVSGNLMLTGTGPLVQFGTTSMSGGTVMYAEYRIIETVSGVDGDTVFNGTFYVTDQTTDEPSQVLFITHSSQSAISAFSDPRTTTGDVGYRVEVRRTSGATVSAMRFYLFTMRAA